MGNDPELSQNTVFGDACKTFTRGYGIACWLLSLEFRKELKLEREMAVSRWYLGPRTWVTDERLSVDRGDERIEAWSWAI